MIHIGDIEENTRPTILVVEDEEDMRQNLVELLSEEFDVLTAENGKQALRIYYNEQFHLNVVLLDIKLPDMSGIEILSKMRNMNLNPDIIMVTALNDTETAVKSMRQGAYDYITKPFFAGDIMATIKRALEKEDYSRKLKEITDRLDRERIASEHRQILFQELQMKGRLEGKVLSPEEKTLFHFPVLTEEDYDYPRLKEKLERDLKAKVEMGEGAEILIAGHDSGLRPVLADSYYVEKASSGREALELLKKKEFDLVLLDVSMPDMNGLDLLTEIKRDHPGVDVMMLTAVKDITVAVKAMKLGAYDYISIPFKQEELKVSIKRVMEKREAKEVLEHLLKKYRETRLSFEPRLLMFKELYARRRKEKSSITMDDFYVFFPEFREEIHGMEIRADFPVFASQEKLEGFIRKLHEKSSSGRSLET
ncbi:MAG: response regulator [Candidatus Saganbacteria bacterium]|nr:response regulator [Candidatus Saganbacteria bacterium]